MRPELGTNGLRGTATDRYLDELRLVRGRGGKVIEYFELISIAEVAASLGARERPLPRGFTCERFGCQERGARVTRGG